MLPKIIFVLCSVFFSSVVLLEFRYHKHEELKQFLQDFVKNSSDLNTRLYSIGKSNQGRELLVVEITGVKEDRLGVPNVKLIGNIHGNEAVGRELLLHFLEYLRDNHKNDSTIRWLMDNTRLHILPSINPDGFSVAHEAICLRGNGRNNGQNKDLNRDFPDIYQNKTAVRAPETQAIIRWMKETPFILSAALHGGALVANYPFDSVKEQTSSFVYPPSISPDNDVFYHLAKVYSQNHLKMYKGIKCNGVGFLEGITNGAAWYPVIGGMQDYNYVYHGCMELTLEISCCKYPKAKELPKLWDENRMALIKYCLEANRGITGQVMDIFTSEPIADAILSIKGRNITFRSTATGEFWRLLLPGNYELQASAPGYSDTVVPFILNHKNSTELSKLLFLEVLLLNNSFIPVTESNIFLTQQHDSNNTPSTNFFLADRSGFDDYEEYDAISLTRSTASGGLRNTAEIFTYTFFIYYFYLYYYYLQ